MELNKLMSIEEKIEMGFIALAKLEVSGLFLVLNMKKLLELLMN